MMNIPTTEDFARLEAKVDAIMARIGISSQVLTIKDLAARYQCSYNKVKYSQPYLMPNNGKSDFGSGAKKWQLKTVEDWESIPLEDRKSAWELEQKNKALLKGQKNKGSR